MHDAHRSLLRMGVHATISVAHKCWCTRPLAGPYHACAKGSRTPESASSTLHEPPETGIFGDTNNGCCALGAMVHTAHIMALEGWAFDVSIFVPVPEALDEVH